MKFKDPAFLRQALVHSSYVNENPELEPESNERLEFLGDVGLAGAVGAGDAGHARAELEDRRGAEALEPVEFQAL